MSLLETSWMLDAIVNGNWAIPEKYKGPELAKVACRRKVESCSRKVIACPQKENLRHGQHERNDREEGKNCRPFPRDMSWTEL